MAQAVNSHPLVLSLERHGGKPSLSLQGRLDYSNVSEATAAVEKLACEEQTCVSLDLGGVESIDTAVIEGLAESANLLKNRQRRLHLRSASPAVQRVLENLLLLDLFCLKAECDRNCPISTSGASPAWAIDVFTLPCEVSRCAEARDRVDGITCEVGFGECARHDIRLAVGEAIANAVSHGRSGHGNDTFTVSCMATGDKICISVSDKGPGFSPENNPTLEEALLLEHGRGLHCIRAVMSELSFNFDNGTTVRMIKNVL